MLIFPKDKTHDEEWIQEHLINPENLNYQENKILYAKSDALRLEQFLKREQEGAVRIIKKKCLEHSKPCEACVILSKRQESNRENELIRSIWENVKAEPGPDGKQRIRHSYLHHHEVATTFPLWMTCVWTYVCTCVWTCVCICVWICVCTCVWSFVWTSVWTFVWTSV